MLEVCIFISISIPACRERHPFSRRNLWTNLIAALCCRDPRSNRAGLGDRVKLDVGGVQTVLGQVVVNSICPYGTVTLQLSVIRPSHVDHTGARHRDIEFGSAIRSSDDRGVGEYLGQVGEAAGIIVKFKCVRVGSKLTTVSLKFPGLNTKVSLPPVRRSGYWFR